MAIKIAMIRANQEGDKLFIKDFRQDEEGRMFVKYSSTYNDIPFVETRVYLVDNNQFLAIFGDDGTIIWRFAVQWIDDIT